MTALLSRFSVTGCSRENGLLDDKDAATPKPGQSHHSRDGSRTRDRVRSLLLGDLAQIYPEGQCRIAPIR
jgi:hypothetical protein